MRPGERHQIGAPRGEDRIGLVGIGDVADRHRRQLGLVADLVGEWRLEHAAVDRLRIGPGLAGGDVDQIRPGFGKRARNLDCFVGRHAVVASPVGGRDAHRHRAVGGPRGAHRGEHLERIAKSISEAPAIIVVALVLQRGDEARQQIAVRGVELDHVEPRVHRHSDRGDELIADHFPIGAGQRAGCGIAFAPRDVACRDQWPIALGQRGVGRFPPKLGRSLGARMTQLEAHFGLTVGVRKIDDPAPRRDMIVRPHAGAAGADPTLGRDAGHFSEHQSGAAHRACAIMHQVKVARRSVDRRIGRHRRDDDAVFEAQVAHRKRGEHWWRGLRFSGRALPEAALDLAKPFGVAEAQILVADALAAGHQRISELPRLEVEIAVQCLEPFGRIARAVLKLQDFQAALGLIFLERLGQRQTRAIEHLGELDRIFERQFCARTDREMRGMRGVADQDDIAIAPSLASDAAEIEPRRRALQMRDIAEQWLAIEKARKDRLAPRDDRGLVHRVEPEPGPRRGRAFDDEGRAIGREAIGVGPDPPRIGLLEGESEGVELPGGAEPDEFVGALVDFDPERRRVEIADATVDAVGGDDQIVIGPGGGIGIAFMIIGDHHAKLFRARRQQVEQMLAADTDETVPRRAVALAADVHLDIVPMRETIADPRCGDGVVGVQIVDRLV